MPRIAPIVLLMLGLLASCGGSDGDYADRMAKEHKGDVPESTPVAEQSPSITVTGREVAYASIDDVEITGYLAHPEGQASGLPGIIVIHEWWGLNDNIRAMTRRLAGEGYIALAVDLYEGQVAESPERAFELMQASLGDTERGLDNLVWAYTYLSELSAVPSVASVGWCFGGGWSLNLALSMPERIDAAVIYYGRLVTDEAELERLAMPVLGIFGELDEGVPLEMVREFEAALTALGKPAEIHVYPGADHAFANPSGTRYQPEAAEDAWQKTLEFLARNLAVEESAD